MEPQEPLEHQGPQEQQVLEVHLELLVPQDLAVL